MVKDVIPRNLDLSPYEGEWVVICDKEIIAHNKNPLKLEKTINNCKTIPTLFLVPEKNTVWLF